MSFRKQHSISIDPDQWARNGEALLLSLVRFRALCHGEGGRLALDSKGCFGSIASQGEFPSGSF